MEPTLQNGDIVIIDKLYYKIPFIASRKSIFINDIVIFKDDNQYSIKRCIANNYSNFSVDGNKIIINNKPLNIEEKKIYLFNSFTNIPKNDIFVLGDNIINSKDSRTIGFINKDDVIGRVIFKL